MEPTGSPRDHLEVVELALRSVDGGQRHESCWSWCAADTAGNQSCSGGVLYARRDHLHKHLRGCRYIILWSLDTECAPHDLDTIQHQHISCLVDTSEFYEGIATIRADVDLVDGHLVRSVREAQLRRDHIFVDQLPEDMWGNTNREPRKMNPTSLSCESALLLQHLGRCKCLLSHSYVCSSGLLVISFDVETTALLLPLLLFPPPSFLFVGTGLG
mmetsp:Transcript_23439/g.45736  ORF Transcript_23439/g.45736 Transcript_23439/m.45736 type:complete len:215 (-) Transcript_23439:216-860(-)